MNTINIRNLRIGKIFIYYKNNQSLLKNNFFRLFPTEFYQNSLYL